MEAGMIWFWMAWSLLAYAVGECLSKWYSLTLLPAFAIGAVLAYAVGAACWLPALRIGQSLSVVGTMWNVGYVLITLGLGVLVFKEALTPLQIIGGTLGLASIILLNL